MKVCNKACRLITGDFLSSVNGLVDVMNWHG